MADKYRYFNELQNGEIEGIDYRICVKERKESPVAIIAPHGGWIEPGTSEIAAAIAKNIHSLYFFEGLRNRPHRDLHIKSENFEEPKCLGLIKRCEIVVAVHGLKDKHCAKDVDVYVGGRDNDLRNTICKGINDAGFQSEVVTTGRYAAVLSDNVCNKGKRSKGVQLEIAKRLRDTLKGEKDLMNAFAKSVWKEISIAAAKLTR